MLDPSTRSLTDDEVLKLLEDKMEEKPEFAKKIVDAIVEKLDQKFGRRQGDIFFELEELQKNQKRSSTSLRITTSDSTL